jgi:SAM-dependent methyltransferase
MGLDHAIRRIIPTTAALTYNPVCKILFDSFDLLPKLMYREIRKIPPNHLRIRIGVGNRIFSNHISYIAGAKNFWIYAFQSGLCRLDSTIVDIGCGCGRYTHHLRDHKFKDQTFTGKYIGIDIDDEMLEWCRRNFDVERFEFHKSTHGSTSYQAGGIENSFYTLPASICSVDFVFSTSLLTHLLENELRNYFVEAYRVLKVGSSMAMFCFSMDHLPPTYGDRHTFKHRVGNAYVESLTSPEAAVAYEESFLFEAAHRAGFRTADIVTAPGDSQPMLLCRK